MFPPNKSISTGYFNRLGNPEIAEDYLGLLAASWLMNCQRAQEGNQKERSSSNQDPSAMQEPAAVER